MDLVGHSLRRPQTLLRLAAAAALTLLLLSGTPAAAAEPRTGEEAFAEQQFLSMANSSRSQASLGPLSPSGAWLEPARDHSEQMSVTNSIFHDPNLSAEAASIGCWKRVGENVGRGFSIDAIHTALMNSPTHRANVLGDFDELGVGVEIAPDGMIYVTQRFLKRCSTAPIAVAPAPAPVVQAPAAPAPGPVKVAAPAPAAAPVEKARPVTYFPFDLGI
jgi:uncharacterized protein YkwD